MKVKCLGVGVAMTVRGEGLCKMALGAFVDLLALYDTPAGRSICFSACCSARCGLIISNISRS